MTADRWAALIGRHYRAILLASLALCAAAGLSLTRLRLDVDVLGMLPRGQPAFDDFKTFAADFGQLDELFVLIDGPRDARQQVADALTARLRGLDTIASVQGRIDTAAAADALLGSFLFNYIPVADYAEVRERLTPEGIAAMVTADKAILAAPFDVSLARTVSEDPLGFRRIAGRNLAGAAGDALPDLDGGYITSHDGNALLLIARPTGSPFDTTFARRLLDQVDAAIGDARAAAPEAPVRVALTGSYVFATEDAATMQADIQRFTALALIGVLAVFWLGYGNLRALPFIAYPLLLSTLLAFALSLLIYDELNALSLSFAAILYGLSIDSGIFFYARLIQARRSHPDDAGAAVAETIGSLAWANVASSTTTAAAFAVIALSSLSVVQQLGVLTAAGMIITIGEFFVLYPALAFLLLRRGATFPAPAETPRFGRWAAASQRHARVVRGAVLALTALLALAASRVGLDPTLNRLRPANSPALRVQEELASRFTRSEQGGAILVGGRDTESALLAAERVAAQLRAYRDDGTLGSAQTVDALLPSAAVQRARLAEYNALPRAAALAILDRELRAQGFKPERFAAFAAGFAAPRTNVVTVGAPALAPLASVVERHVRERPGGTMVAAYVEPGAGATWLDIAARVRADLPDLPVAVAARPLLEDTLRGVLRSEVIMFIGLGVLVNLLLLWLTLGNLRDSAAVLVPVLLVVIAVFAVMSAAGMAVDPVNLVVTPLLVGIGVDNGAYLTTATREHGDVGSALRLRGRAICISSATTIVGFGVLALSTYPPLATLGTLMAIGLSLAVAASTLVHPAFMRAPGK